MESDFCLCDECGLIWEVPDDGIPHWLKTDDRCPACGAVTEVSRLEESHW